MKINWKVRFKNKTWLLAFLGTVVTFIYQILGMLSVVPPISEDLATQVIGIFVNLLVALGIVQDPTTTGLSDSTRALSFDRPAGNCKTEEEAAE